MQDLLLEIIAESIGDYASEQITLYLQMVTQDNIVE